MNATANEVPSFDVPMFYLALAVVAGLAVVIAIAASFLPLARIKVPAIVVSSIGCLVLGLALGMIIMAVFGYRWYPQPAPKLPPGAVAPVQIGQMPDPAQMRPAPGIPAEAKDGPSKEAAETAPSPPQP
jgi:hypothetical protein